VIIILKDRRYCRQQKCWHQNCTKEAGSGVITEAASAAAAACGAVCGAWPASCGSSWNKQPSLPLSSSHLVNTDPRPDLASTTTLLQQRGA